MTNGVERGLRIAHVQPQTLDLYGHRDEELGGDVRYFLSNLAEAQARLGHRPVVHLLTSTRGRTKRHAFRGVDVRFHPCLQPPRRSGIRHRFARQLSASMLRAVAADRPDIVHFHGVRQFHLMYGAVAVVSRRVGLPVVGREDGYRPVGRVESRAQLAGLRRTSAVLAANQAGVEEIARLGYPTERITLVPNGFDPSIFHPDDAPRPPTREGPLRILSVTRLSSEKDPLTLVRAVQRLRSSGRDVELTIAGDGPLRREIESELRQSGVPADFLGHVPQPRLARLYRQADVFCLTSLGEGANQAVVEAMASGLPAVVTRVACVLEVAEGAALLVDPGDEASFAAAISQVTDHPDRWLAQRSAGLDRSAGLSWHQVALQVQDVYTQVLLRRTSGATPPELVSG